VECGPARGWVRGKMAARVTEDDVKRVAELAHLELAPEERPRMLKDLNAILNYIDELNELDTTGVAPLEQVGELSAFAGELRPGLCPGLCPGLRIDQLVPSLARADVMQQAPESDGAFFKVPKVIER
jgi:aspartyl-tRNA(Asn)/glutamyl-tRNA(Gln) amidotransferase subunit C